MKTIKKINTKKVMRFSADLKEDHGKETRGKAKQDIVGDEE